MREVSPPPAVVAELLECLERLHEGVRDTVLAATAARELEVLATPAGEDDGDTLYAIDRIGEAAIVAGLLDFAQRHPLVLVGEGIPGGRLVLPEGTAPERLEWRLIVDPIDGTRGLMYQKRSAWILSAAAPDRGEATGLADLVLAVQTEIPILKQNLCDQIAGRRGGPVRCRRLDRSTGRIVPFPLRPSRAPDLEHGFASLVRFFPETDAGLEDFSSAFFRAVMGPPVSGRARCFEDQYLSSAGQLYELMTGHDRLVVDLRGLVAERQRRRGEAAVLCAHPYDLCTALLAEAVGVILREPSGGALDAVLDTTSELSWVGYANPSIRAGVEPVLARLLQEKGLVPPRN